MFLEISKKNSTKSQPGGAYKCDAYKKNVLGEKCLAQYIGQTMSDSRLC